MTSPQKIVCTGLIFMFAVVPACRRGREQTPDVKEPDVENKPVVSVVPPKVDQKPAPKGIGEATRVAYQQLGGLYVGWKETERGFQQRYEFKESDEPGFRFGVFPTSELPQIDVPFGLDLSISNVKDVDLRQVARLEKLAILNLDATSVTDAGLKELVALPNLRVLHLMGVKFSENGLRHLASMHSLVELNLTLSALNDEGAKELAKMQQLVHLHLSGTKLTDAGLRDLGGLPKLVSLDVSTNMLITDAGLDSLAGLKEIAHLDLTRTQISDAGLRKVAQVRNLRTLNLTDTGVSDAGMKPLASLDKLSELNVQQTRVTDKGLRELAGLRSLVLLDLDGNQQTDASLIALREIGLLHAFRFVRGRDGNRAKSMDEIVTADLRSTSLSDVGLQAFAGLKISTLNLAGTKVTDAGVATLQKTMPNCKVIR